MTQLMAVEQKYVQPGKSMERHREAAMIYLHAARCCAAWSRVGPVL